MDSQVEKVSKRSVAKVTCYKAFWNTPEGRKVLEDMILHHNVMSSSFVKDDPYETAFKEGERNVILRILSIIKINPKKMIKLIEEIERHTDENEQSF